MYDPIVGRFLEEDPEGFGAGDPNLYRYVWNSPTNFTDPSGMTLYIPFSQADDAWWAEFGGNVKLIPRPNGRGTQVVVQPEGRNPEFHAAVLAKLNKTRMSPDDIATTLTALFDGGVRQADPNFNHTAGDRVFFTDPWPHILTLRDAGYDNSWQQAIDSYLSAWQQIGPALAQIFPGIEGPQKSLPTDVLRQTPAPLTAAKFEIKVEREYRVNNNFGAGIDVRIIFHPDPKIPANKDTIRLVQILRRTNEAGEIDGWAAGDPFGRDRLGLITTDTGWFVDCHLDDDGLNAGGAAKGKEQWKDSTGRIFTQPPFYSAVMRANGLPFYGEYFGTGEQKGSNIPGQKPVEAAITDSPFRSLGTYQFETVAVNTETGAILGSVRWGFRVTRPQQDKPPVVEFLPVITSRYATSDFLAALSKFDAQFAALAQTAIMAAKLNIHTNYFPGTLQDRLDILNKFTAHPAIHDDLLQLIEREWAKKFAGK